MLHTLPSLLSVLYSFGIPSAFRLSSPAILTRHFSRVPFVSFLPLFCPPLFSLQLPSPCLCPAPSFKIPFNHYHLSLVVINIVVILFFVRPTRPSPCCRPLTLSMSHSSSFELLTSIGLASLILFQFARVLSDFLIIGISILSLCALDVGLGLQL